MSSIEFRDLTVKFGKRTVVHGFTDTVRSGEWLGLIGPNGAGKSSILRAIVGVIPSAGEVFVDGSSMTLRSRSRRAAGNAWPVPAASILPRGGPKRSAPPRAGSARGVRR